MNQENIARNKQYTALFLVFPLASILPYLPTLFAPRTAFLSLLSISSLLYTAYLLYVFPYGVTGISILDSLNNNTSGSDVSKHLATGDGGPLAKYLPYLNVGLSMLLVVAGWVFRGREELWWGFGGLPAGVYVGVLMAKVVMGSVDPEGELSRLKYEFKGA